MTPQQANELLPCPFCGCQPVQFTEDDDEGIECKTCEFLFGPYAKFEHAIAAWNRRAPAPTSEPGARDLTVDQQKIKDAAYSLVLNKKELFKQGWPLFVKIADELLATPAVPADFLDQLEHAIGGYSGGPFDAVSALIAAHRVHPNCGACPGDGTICKASCRVSDESPAPLVAQASPVAWFEAEPSAKGRPLREVMGGMIYSTRWHTTKPDMLNNALWPLYEHPAPEASPLVEDAERIVEGKVEAWPMNPTCGCRACNPQMAGKMMFLCSACGNKRCPHATDHQHACTNSNEPNQEGSAYDFSQRATTGNATADDGKDK